MSVKRIHHHQSPRGHRPEDLRDEAFVPRDRARGCAVRVLLRSTATPPPRSPRPPRRAAWVREKPPDAVKKL
ncbi:hypothetical protein QJS66_07930 [Kocuria rhizophila]|nr:hypothetical protein QJS66_07930 [Kocuria rhizophila]